MTGIHPTHQESVCIFSEGTLIQLFLEFLLILLLISWIVVPNDLAFAQEAPELSITKVDEGVFLEWSIPEGQNRWIILKSSDPFMRNSDTLAITSTSSWLDRSAYSMQGNKQFYRVLPWFPGETPNDIVIIEDFEDGEADLIGYMNGDENEDIDPESVEVIEGGPGDSQFQLQMNGNSWKIQPIDPINLEFSTIWAFEVYMERMSTRQMIGIGDGEDVMFYGLWGESLSPSGTDKWIMSYLGWFNEDEWQTVYLPVGEDWHGRYANDGIIDRIIYVNDNDNQIIPGVIYFDNLRDATGAQPIPPDASFNWSVQNADQDSITLQFYNLSRDLDSDDLTYRWSFGDGNTSSEEHPLHTYPRGGSWPVALSVNDDSISWDYHIESVVDSPLVRQSDFTIACMGDVVFRGDYADHIDNYGLDYPFGLVADYVRAADLAICNLENPMTNANTRHPTKSIVFRARPADTEALQRAGYDFVTLANNHTFDYLADGMHETMDVLDNLNILWGGAGDNDVQARQVVHLSHGGKNLGILSSCNRDGHYNTANQPWGPQPFLDANRNRPGFAFWSRSTIEATVPQAAEDCDLVMIQTHSGSEYSRYPRNGEKNSLEYVEEVEYGDDYVTFELHPDSGEVALRHYAIDLGADVVVCHHPHIIQGVELYNGKLIVHSLGNFLMDLGRNDCNATMIAEIHVGADSIDAAVLRPAWIGSDDRPSILHGEQAANLLDYLTYYSKLLNTSLIRLPGEEIGHVFWDTLAARTEEEHLNSYFWYPGENEYRSRPIKMTGEGYTTRAILDDPPGGNLQVRVGRDIMLWATMEDEGYQPWSIDSDNEFYDDEKSHDGQQSFKIDIPAGDANGSYSTDVQTRVRIYEYPHSFLGWINTENANNAEFEVRFHDSNGNLASSLTPVTLDGSFDWTPVFADFDVINGNMDYLNVRMSMDRPQNGVAEAWFDDVAFIQWEDWQDLDEANGIDLTFPNGYRFIQFRTDENPGNNEFNQNDLTHDGELDEQGGPDETGYVYIDSQEAEGPVFNWVDISGTGTEINNMEDDAFQGPFDLPFEFVFYGNTYDQVYIESNGYISFGEGSNVWRNGFIPNPAAPNNLICLFRDDLNPEVDGNIYYGTDPDGNWICQYDNIPEYGANGRITAEIILHPNGEITLQYLSLTNGIQINGEYIGIENATGTVGLLVSNQNDPANYPFNELAIQFTPPIMDASVSGTVIDQDTNLPVAGAVVRFGGFEAVTDDEGRYEIEEIFSQTFNVSISAEDYFIHMDTVTLVEGANVYNASLTRPPLFQIRWTNEWPSNPPAFRGIIEENRAMR